MPQAPTDYQTRYPIDFGDIDPAIGQTVVQLYGADGVKSHGILYLPPKHAPRTVVVMAHPRADFFHHYSIPYWVQAGFAAFAQNTRYLNNDSMMLHENLLIDLAAGIRYLREERGFDHIVMLGNSGGGSLFAYYDAEARKLNGSRVAAPPGGGPPDLNKFELPLADGFIVLAAHLGQGIKRKQIKERCQELEQDIRRVETALTQLETALQRFVSAEQTERASEELKDRRHELESLMEEWEKLAQMLEDE